MARNGAVAVGKRGAYFNTILVPARSPRLNSSHVFRCAKPAMHITRSLRLSKRSESEHTHAHTHKQQSAAAAVVNIDVFREFVKMIYR